MPARAARLPSKGPAPEKGRGGKDGASAGLTLSLHLRNECLMNDSLIHNM